MPLLGQQMWRQGLKNHMGFTGTRYYILVTLSLSSDSFPSTKGENMSGVSISTQCVPHMPGF